VLTARAAGRPLLGGGVVTASSAPRDLGAAVLAESDTRAIRELLSRRAAALLRGDREAFLADVDKPFADRQRSLFENLRDVPVSAWMYDVRPESAVRVGPGLAGRYGADVWVSEIDLQYALTGFDDRPVSARQYMTFVHRGGRWLVGGDDDVKGSVRGPWDFGRVAVARSAHGLVLARREDAALASEVSVLLEKAVTRVGAAWRGWRGKAVVLVAGNADEVRAMVPGESDLSQIAAITAAELGERGTPLGERVVINPGPFRALDASLRQVVVQHEVTHLATSATTSASTPTWLSEGYADHLGYLGQSPNVRAAAKNLAPEVRRGQLPDGLPSEGEFAPDSPRLAIAYEASWLACRFIAARIGEDGLARFYRTVSGGPGDADASLDSGLRSLLGLKSEEFVALWRQYVRAQLR
jgi:hypothetical protein